MSPTGITRRHTLTAAVGVTTATSLASTGLLAAPAIAAPQPLKNDELKEALRRVEARRRRLLTDRPSANQWEMEKVADAGGDITSRPVPGTGLNVSVRKGDTATVLVHVIRRFHYEIATLGLHGEPNPIEGWMAPSTVRDSQLPEANRASGTAIVIRPDFYPPGVRGGFTPGQHQIIRDIIADTEGIVRWGGEDRRPYEGLFYLTVPPGDARLKRVAAKIRAWGETPGAGAGVVLDVTEPSRRRRAARYR
ncbi:MULTISPECIES: hypothetical protein [Streptomyces]|uniref:Uncharacterized protein n=1 Tax=Streptomyces mordarskii TaxID=1226758 RepID=A0ABN1DYC5_9ACTN|nr:hypothetical protein [Streptomyces sp. WAC05858]RSS45979.1 hypothetical protein EF902_13010 [Streptomyces sp. WAC05858]WTA83761.1 hypothetical protein OG751_29925 [Streptomyces antimycoticus]